MFNSWEIFFLNYKKAIINLLIYMTSLTGSVPLSFPNTSVKCSVPLQCSVAVLEESANTIVKRRGVCAPLSSLPPRVLQSELASYSPGLGT